MNLFDVCRTKIAVAAMEHGFSVQYGQRAMQLIMLRYQLGAGTSEKELEILSMSSYYESLRFQLLRLCSRFFRLHAKRGRPYRSSSKSIKSKIVKGILRHQPSISEADRTRKTASL